MYLRDRSKSPPPLVRANILVTGLNRLSYWMAYGPLGVRWQPRTQVGNCMRYTRPKRLWCFLHGKVEAALRFSIRWTVPRDARPDFMSKSSGD